MYVLWALNISVGIQKFLLILLERREPATTRTVLEHSIYVQ